MRARPCFANAPRIALVACSEAARLRDVLSARTLSSIGRVVVRENTDSQRSGPANYTNTKPAYPKICVEFAFIKRFNSAHVNITGKLHLRDRQSSSMRPIHIESLGARALVFLASSLTFAACTIATAQTVQVDVTPSHVVNTFSPLYALGSTVDRVPSNASDMFFRPDQIAQIQQAGWGVISYRQNTDLFVQAWHWNPKGKWSDASGQGYFVGDATPTQEMIRHSYGYSLPHRGFTRNNGTEFDGFSRLDDGDPNTYWKSNPYLTKRFTGEDDSLHPQWIVINLEKVENINAIRIVWAAPFARAYEVQYWTGNGDAMDEQNKGSWKRFASGTVTSGRGGTTTLRLDTAPVSTK